MKVKVYAKLNLTLNVGEKQGAFHPIDSVATSVDVYDTVEVVSRADSQVNVYGVKGVEQQCNTAYKAAVAFKRAFLSNLALGVDIFIQKGIPLGAGLGGSSADAAAVVYCMCKLFNVDVNSREVHQLCSAIGSDVCFMLFGGLGRLQGKGDDVTFYKMTKPLYLALTTFDVSMSSGDIYSAFDKITACKSNDVCLLKADELVKHTVENCSNDALLNLLQQGATDKAIALFTNDLQQATLSVSNYAEHYLQFVKSNNLVCNMTGSGSAYYVACSTRVETERLANLLNTNGFSTTVCSSVPTGIVEIE